MADNFDAKVTPEQLNQFNMAVAKLKEANERQIEIIDRILEGEIEIGKQRIASLNTFFDVYFQKLDQVAHKCDELPEAFQILAHANKFSSSKPFVIEYKHTGGDGAGGEPSKGRPNNKSSKQSGDSTNSKYTDRSFEGDLADLGDSQENIDAKKARLEDIQDFLNNLVKQGNTEQERLNTELTNLKMAQTHRVFNEEKRLINTLAAFELAKAQDNEERILELRLQKRQELLSTQIETQNAENILNAELGLNLDEAANYEAEMDAAKERNKLIKDLEKKRLDYIAAEELKAKMKNNNVLDAEEAKRIIERANEKFKLDEENIAKLTKLQMQEHAKALAEQMNENLNILATKGTIADKKEALKALTTDENGNLDKQKTTAALLTVVGKLGDLAKQLEAKIDTIAGYKGFIDTRLQGSSNKTWLGSYWDQLTKDMMRVGLVTPYFKQEKFAENIKSLVDKGIAFDLKQRAFLQTIQEKIANTFDVADGTLLRLIRIQQEDSTAGRLGMESALNTFLNSMYENSEYLNSVADSVRGSLLEMESLMSGTMAAEVEYQVQKWMGSLFSVGMSDTAVNSITGSLGQIASGQIEGLTSGGTGNLIIMAASKAGIPIADMLTNGIDAKETNRLLQATVDYLAEIAEASADNQVVRQQLASVFGVKASDIRAATNLASKGSIASIANSNYSYDMMLNQLFRMAGSMGSRTSLGEKMNNIWDNGQYSLASSMSNNPVSYLIYKMAKLLDAAAGGIDLPFVNVMGFGVDLNTTVSDLMRVAAMGSGIILNLGTMVSGLANSFSGRAMLNNMGINSGSGLAVTPRGAGVLSSALGVDGGIATSGSGYVGNASVSDIKNTTLQEAADTKQSLMVEAQENAEKNQVDEINATVLKIYQLLDDVVKGSSTLRVRVDSYGLVDGGNHGGRNSFLAGPAGIASQANNVAAASGYIGNVPPPSSNNMFFSGALDVGSWVLT